MERKGIRWGCYGLLMWLVWVAPVFADETADDITNMMAWWDEMGRDWDEAAGLMQLASDDGLVCVLAGNAVGNSDEVQ